MRISDAPEGRHE